MSERVNTLKIKREFELKKQSKRMSKNTQNDHINTEAALQIYTLEKVFWKYAANLQKTHAELWFQ